MLDCMFYSYDHGHIFKEYKTMPQRGLVVSHADGIVNPKPL